MTNTRRLLATVVAALLLMVIMGKLAGAQQETAAPGEMRAFLHSWLVQDDLVDTVAHFSSSDRSMSLVPTYIEDQSDVCWFAEAVAQPTAETGMVPPGVACGYWKFLHALWPGAGGGRVDVDVEELLMTDQGELLAFLDENLELKIEDYVQKSPFIVFSANDRIKLNAFDAGFAAGGYGQLAETLQPSEEHPILTMIADFKHKHEQLQHIGPLVTFWDEEESSDGTSEWRIQAFGAFPVN